MNTNPIRDVESLQNYANSIEIGPPLFERIRTLFEFAQSLSPSPIVDVFISEYLDGEKKRQFGNVYFFYEKGLLESERWITETKLWLFSMKPPDFLTFSSKEGTWSTHGPSPSLKIEGGWADHFRVELMATGENCSKLIEVHKTFFCATSGVASTESGSCDWSDPKWL